MHKKLPILFLALAGIFLFHGYRSNAQNELTFNRYHNYAEVLEALQAFHRVHPATTALHTIATSPGGHDVVILETGKNLNDASAVFVGANLEGITPLATEGASLFSTNGPQSGRGWRDQMIYSPPAQSGCIRILFFIHGLSISNQRPDG